jgi:hypothetical protein
VSLKKDQFPRRLWNNTSLQTCPKTSLPSALEVLDSTRLKIVRSRAQKHMFLGSAASQHRLV